MPTDGLLVALDQLMQANITQEQSSRLRVFADGEAGHADTRGRVSSETFVKQAGSLNLTKSPIHGLMPRLRVCLLLCYTLPRLHEQNEESIKEKEYLVMEFMVSARFRPQNQAEILARIPQEQARIKALREQGTVEALYVSSDRSHVWIVMQGESQDQVQKELESLPLYPYMEVAITPLSSM